MNTPAPDLTPEAPVNTVHLERLATLADGTLDLATMLTSGQISVLTEDGYQAVEAPAVTIRAAAQKARDVSEPRIASWLDAYADQL